VPTTTKTPSKPRTGIICHRPLTGNHAFTGQLKGESMTPTTEAHAFLLNLMHDPHAPMRHRIKAAKKLISAGLGDIAQVHTIHIVITGGLPEYIDTWMCEDINDCITRTDPCPWSNIIRSIQGARFTSCKDQATKDRLNKDKNLQ
jgi:hypothetical protein